MAFSVGCAGKHEPLQVKQFYLRDQKDKSIEDPMVNGEKLRRLYGAVSMDQRRERLGQYYTILWNDAGTGPVELIFEYQRGGSGSLVHKSRAEFAAADTSGKAEFSITGDDYFKNGKVLAWKVTLSRGGREVATKQSYLWKD